MLVTKMSAWLLKHSLVYHTCIYNDNNNIKIFIPHDGLKSIREGYQLLMSITLKHFYNDVNLKAIQKLTMMIGVINISDVCTSDGRIMDKSFLLSKQKYRRRNGHKWPLKHHVLSTDYTVWRKLLKKILCGKNTNSQIDYADGY